MLLASLAPAVPAQEPAPPAPAGSPQPAVQTPSSQPPAAAEASAPAPQVAPAGALGTVLVATCKVKCWPTELSPAFEDTLPQQAVVAVGRSETGHRQVLLPSGPLGYVSRKFTTEPAEGRVHTKGKGVAFRYRPRTGEAPVVALPEGTELVVVGEQPEWWQVRCAAVEAWVVEAEVQVAAEPTAAMQQAWAALQKQYEGQSAAWLARQAELAELARKAAEQTKLLAALDERMQAETRKPLAEQRYEPIETDLEQLAAELAADSPLAPKVAALKQGIADRKWVAEATAVRDAEPEPLADPPKVQKDVPDVLDRFNTIGWLRWQRGLTGPGQFVVEKGGQSLYVVQCSSGRYDLALFVDKEVGLIGPRIRPGSESLRNLDVEKLEVLGLPRR